MDERKLAMLAYQAYGKSVGYKNYQGLPMPQWGNLSPAIKDAWVAAAKESVARQHAADLIKLRQQLDDREFLQIKHAFYYNEAFKGAGIPGHEQFILLAKLAKALGF